MCNLYLYKNRLTIWLRRISKKEICYIIIDRLFLQTSVIVFFKVKCLQLEIVAFFIFIKRACTIIRTFHIAIVANQKGFSFIKLFFDESLSKYMKICLS